MLVDCVQALLNYGIPRLSSGSVPGAPLRSETLHRAPRVCESPPTAAPYLPELDCRERQLSSGLYLSFCQSLPVDCST